MCILFLVEISFDWRKAKLQQLYSVTFFVAGTVLVTFSFAFIFNKCLICGQSTIDWGFFAWYAPYVIVFQIGWAAVQVIFLYFVVGSYSPLQTLDVLKLFY